MKEIPLTHGKVTLVDDADYEQVAQYKWHLHPDGYAVGWCGGVRLRLHRLIMNAAPGQQVDHANGDRLDNRRCNLRFATCRQNNANRRKKVAASSQYIGVCWDKDRGRWFVQIRVNGQSTHIGRFTSEIDAARAYDAAAVKYHGEFAKRNFVAQA